MCQRYYEKSYNLTTAPGSATSVGVFGGTLSTDGGTNVVGHIAFSVAKRTAPTITAYDGNGVVGNWLYFTATTNGTRAINLERQNTFGFGFFIGADFAWISATTLGQWTASAEL
jgi:hypothetical protein